MVAIVLILASFVQEQDQPIGGVFDRLEERIAARFDKSEKAIEAQQQKMEGFLRDWWKERDETADKQVEAMEGVLSDWRKQRAEERKERAEAAAEERKLRREQFEFERKKRKEAWSKQAEEIKRNFTPIKGLVERLEALMVSLRGLLWQAALTIAAVVFVTLLLFSGIRWAWDKFLANVVGYPFKWILSQLTGVK